MCLYADEETARPAENDIVCYKVMRHVYCNDRYALRSQYYDFNYNVGKSYLCYDFSKEAERSIIRHDNYIVERGFHSYMKLDMALFHAEDSFNSCALVIVKCIIPKGTLMFSAVDDYEYCSERIKVIGYESFTNVDKAFSARCADSIKWKETIESPKERECAVDNDGCMSGVRKIIKALKSWMGKK